MGTRTATLPSTTLPVGHPRGDGYRLWDASYGDDVRELRDQVAAGLVDFTGLEFG